MLFADDIARSLHSEGIDESLVHCLRHVSLTTFAYICFIALALTTVLTGPHSVGGLGREKGCRCCVGG
jgi:hypothetical protein